MQITYKDKTKTVNLDKTEELIKEALSEAICHNSTYKVIIREPVFDDESNFIGDSKVRVLTQGTFYDEPHFFEKNCVSEETQENYLRDWLLEDTNNFPTLNSFFENSNIDKEEIIEDIIEKFANKELSEEQMQDIESNFDIAIDEWYDESVNLEDLINEWQIKMDEFVPLKGNEF